MSVNDKAEARLAELRKMSADYAAAYAERNYLEEFKKSKLAMLMKQAELDGRKTAAAQEREARADPDYVSLLNSLKIATEISEQTRWHLEIAKLGVAVWQTSQANERGRAEGVWGVIGFQSTSTTTSRSYATRCTHLQRRSSFEKASKKFINTGWTCLVCSKSEGRLCGGRGFRVRAD
jgi:hypothetical protein